MLQFTGVVKALTDDACLMNIDGVTGWVPESLLDYTDEPVVGEEIRLDIQGWFAEKKGFL